MKQYFLYLLILISFNSFSQSSFTSESFDVSRHDLETNIYEKDSTANALILYEYGNSYIDKKDFDLKTEIKRKVKILNRKGFDQATITIHLYNDKNTKQEVKDIKATTFNLLNGKVESTRLKSNNIFTEKIDKNNTVVKFTLPAIKEGSVFTYSYRISSPFVFKYHGWHFQGSIPTLYSEYSTSIPGNYEYHIKLIGYLKLFKEDRVLKRDCLTVSNGGAADCTNTTYIMKDIPAFIEEDYMTSKYNYLSRIEYEMKTFQGFDNTIKHYTKTWKSVDNELKTEPTIGRQLNKNIKPEDLLPSEIVSEASTIKKAKDIYQYVQNNYAWNGEDKIFNEVSIKDLLEDKSGNSASINILLHNLLEESSYDVKPVLVSTRSNGFPTKIYPVITDFNYILVQITINNKKYLLDATDKYLNFGQIPFKCLNHYGRLLDFKNGSEWIDIIAPEVSSIQYKLDLRINENDMLSGQIFTRQSGYYALDKKKDFYSDPTNYLENLQNRLPTIEILEHEVISSGIVDERFEEKIDIKFSEESIVADKIYFNPFTFKFFDENPFKLQERSYPIDFGYKKAYVYSLSLDIGDKYDIVEVPDGITVKLPNNVGEFAFANQTNGKILKLYFKISFKEPKYDPAYYQYLKKFMSQIVNTQKNSLIVLQKK